ncbi:Uncharacterised protein [Staphylococcus gallinarum]|uniref:Uncharacterized protein n=1 Tax=Staphylococcus gallinarum TaxID=1293 RepID=A0A380FD84_STAGA|nr:Uncharacterised protein [Staphylococcus gallinarum]
MAVKKKDVEDIVEAVGGQRKFGHSNALCHTLKISLKR